VSQEAIVNPVAREANNQMYVPHGHT
jgi:hypothetical protein